MRCGFGSSSSYMDHAPFPACHRRARRQDQAGFAGRFARLDPSARRWRFCHQEVLLIEPTKKGRFRQQNILEANEPRRLIAVIPKGPERQRRSAEGA
jgi:hypothetical protein